MRILSTKWLLCDSVTEIHIWKEVIAWIESCKFYKELAEQLFTVTEDCDLDCHSKYDRLQRLKITSENEKLYAIKLQHRFYSQVWSTEIIFSDGGNEKTLTLHLDSFSDTESQLFPSESNTEIFRRFVSSGLLASDNGLQISARPIMADENIIMKVVNASRGNSEYILPVLYISKLNHCCGYEVDPERLARKLAGTAHVIVEPNIEYSLMFKHRTEGRNPHNGFVGVYIPRMPTKIFKPTIGTGGFESFLSKYIFEVSTSLIDGQLRSWDSINTKKFEAESHTQNTLLEAFGEENISLEDRVKRLEEKNKQLINENMRLNILCSDYKATFNASRDQGLLKCGNISEFFPSEQNDLVISILNAAKNGLNRDTRAYELLDAILLKNPLKGQGLDIITEIKNVFANNLLKDKDFARLQKFGFELVSDNGHKKLIYEHNPKYTFIISNTPSDWRNGKNIMSDILKKISIYKKCY